MAKKWAVLRAERIARLKELGESKECLTCHERHSAGNYDRYLEGGKVKWPHKCWKCGGRRPLGAQAATGSPTESMREKRGRMGTSPTFRIGYQDGGIGVEMDLFVDALQKAYLMKGMAIASGSKSPKALKFWSMHRDYLAKGEKIRQKLLTEAQWKPKEKKDE